METESVSLPRTSSAESALPAESETCFCRVSLLSMQYIVGFYLVLLGADCVLLAFSRVGSRE